MWVRVAGIYEGRIWPAVRGLRCEAGSGVPLLAPGAHWTEVGGAQWGGGSRGTQAWLGRRGGQDEGGLL